MATKYTLVDTGEDVTEHVESLFAASRKAYRRHELALDLESRAFEKSESERYTSAWKQRRREFFYREQRADQYKAACHKAQSDVAALSDQNIMEYSWSYPIGGNEVHESISYL